MKQKLQRFSLYLLFFQTGLTMGSNEKILAEIGKKISLPCGDSTNGEKQEIQWNKDGSMFMRYNRNKVKTFGKAVPAGSNRFDIQPGITNNLEMTAVQLIDAGTFTCKKSGSDVKTVELIVFEGFGSSPAGTLSGSGRAPSARLLYDDPDRVASAETELRRLKQGSVLVEPSNILLMSENLKLSVKSSPVMNFDVSWLKNDIKITDGPNVELKNITIEQSGDYTCCIKMNDGAETCFSKTIRVKGIIPSPAIVYMSGKKPITLPFIFNFKVRDSPLQDEVRAIEGNIKYLSSTVQTLTVTSGAACWPQKCQTKSDPEDLSASIRSPQSGLYQMEIVLKIGEREKKLQREVCVANLTVSTSHNIMVSESNITLLCSINCIEKDGRLCWRHENKSYEICGPPGKGKLAKEITVAPETTGNWTCGVLIGEKRLASINLTLELPQGFLSSPLFWVTVVVGVIVFLLIVIILTIMIARHRRVRRARYRAWILENLHHDRRCECNYKGFAPQRLRQNI